MLILAAMARGLGVDFSEEDLYALEPEARRSRAMLLLSRVQVLSPGLDVSRFAMAIKVHSHAFRHYSPRFYPGRITLFRAIRKDTSSLMAVNEADRDIALRWREYSSEPIEVHDVPGDHFSMVVAPNVQTLAAQLGQCLLSADPASSAASHRKG